MRAFGGARLLAVLPAFFLENCAGPTLILFHGGRDFGGDSAGGLQGCEGVLLELWPENTLERIVLAGAAL